MEVPRARAARAAAARFRMPWHGTLASKGTEDSADSANAEPRKSELVGPVPISVDFCVEVWKSLCVCVCLVLLCYIY